MADLRRVLCLLGRHDWQTSEGHGWRFCTRCGMTESLPNDDYEPAWKRGNRG